MSRPRKTCLSSADIQTMDMLIEGMVPKKIALARGEDAGAVRWRLNRVKRELGAKTVIQAAVMYVRPKKL